MIDYDPMIVIADDSKTSRKALEILIKQLGFKNIFSVKTGCEAYKVCKKEQGFINLIFMDQFFGTKLPNGIETSQKIASSFPKIPIILYTSSTITTEVPNIHGLLQKPADKDTLQLYLETFLDEDILSNL